MTKRPTIEVYLHEGGHGVVKYDGKEIPHASALTITARVGEPTKAVIEVIGVKVVGKWEATEAKLEVVPITINTPDSP